MKTFLQFPYPLLVIKSLQEQSPGLPVGGGGGGGRGSDAVGSGGGDDGGSDTPGVGGGLDTAGVGGGGGGAHAFHEYGFPHGYRSKSVQVEGSFTKQIGPYLRNFFLQFPYPSITKSRQEQSPGLSGVAGGGGGSEIPGVGE